MTKRCFKCKERKELTEFWKHIRRKDGFCDHCKVCMKIWRVSYKQTDSYRASERKSQKKILSTLRGYASHRFNAIYQRCNNKNDSMYKTYGAKGVQCLFKDFQDFFDYITVELAFSTVVSLRGLHIHRIGDGDYKRGGIALLTPLEHAQIHKLARQSLVRSS